MLEESIKLQIKKDFLKILFSLLNNMFWMKTEWKKEQTWLDF
jgi:hypothetical protein